MRDRGDQDRGGDQLPIKLRIILQFQEQLALGGRQQTPRTRSPQKVVLHTHQHHPQKRDEATGMSPPGSKHRGKRYVPILFPPRIP